MVSFGFHIYSWRVWVVLGEDKCITNSMDFSILWEVIKSVGTALGIGKHTASSPFKDMTLMHHSSNHPNDVPCLGPPTNPPQIIYWQVSRSLWCRSSSKTSGIYISLFPASQAREPNALYPSFKKPIFFFSSRKNCNDITKKAGAQSISHTKADLLHLFSRSERIFHKKYNDQVSTTRRGECYLIQSRLKYPPEGEKKKLNFYLKKFESLPAFHWSLNWIIKIMEIDQQSWN